jgi:hypothetical protein
MDEIKLNKLKAKKARAEANLVKVKNKEGRWAKSLHPEHCEACLEEQIKNLDKLIKEK